MRVKRQRHSDSFKAKVALAALKGDRTAAQLASAFDLHATQVSQWKRAIVDRLPEVFEHGATAQAEASEREVARLEQKVGQLTMELDWLKKKSRQLGL